MPQERARHSTREGRILLGLTLIAFGLRFFALARQSVWVDEAFSIKYAAVFGRFGWDQWFENLHGPLHALLLHLWSRLFGTGEAALRSLSALFGAATVPLLYWAVRPRLDRAPALLAAGLLAVSPFHLWYSQEIRNYALLIFFVVLSSGAYLHLPAGGGRGALYTLANLFGFLSNLAHLFAVMIQAGYEWATQRRIRRLALVSWGITALALSPWIYRFWVRHLEPSGALDLAPIEATERLRGETTAPWLGIPFTYFVFSVGYSLGPSLRELRQGMGFELFRPDLPLLLAAMIGFGGAVLLGGRAAWRLRGEGRYWLLLAFLPTLLTFLVALRNLKVFNPRYAAAALPAYVVLLALGLLAPRRIVWRWLLALCILVPTGVSLGRYFTDPRYDKDDARAAAAFLRSEAKPGELLFVVGTDEPFERYHWRGMRRGADGIRKADLGDWGMLTRAQQFARFDSLIAAHPRTYVIVFRAEAVDPAGQWRRWMAEQHPPERTREFTGIDVWVLPRSDAGPQP
ncbi:MAG: glycosyltransferase family 39 protein [Candidatus Eisenbacteria bacterium]|nr:glycosyltransferase family 39 protein [Candidatus Eisenbacteria bacterium]